MLAESDSDWNQLGIAGAAVVKLCLEGLVCKEGVRFIALQRAGSISTN
jgi:hypothetical protein